MQEVIGTASLMLLVVLMYWALKGPFWWLYQKVLPAKPKPKVDLADLYDIKGRELALTQRHNKNYEERRAWQKDFDKLVKATCKHEWNTFGNRPFCRKCRTDLQMYQGYYCTCEWETALERTFGSGLHEEIVIRFGVRDRECPDHGDKALKTRKK